MGLKSLPRTEKLNTVMFWEYSALLNKERFIEIKAYNLSNYLINHILILKFPHFNNNWCGISDFLLSNNGLSSELKTRFKLFKFRILDMSKIKKYIHVSTYTFQQLNVYHTLCIVDKRFKSSKSRLGFRWFTNYMLATENKNLIATI